MNSYSLAFKINIYIFVITFLVFAALVAFVSMNVNQHSYDSQKQSMSQQAGELKDIIEIWISENSALVYCLSVNHDIIEELIYGSYTQSSSIVTDIYSSKKFFETVFIADKSGKIVVSSNKSSVGSDIKNLPCWQACKDGKKEYIDKAAYKSTITNNPAFIVASPIYDKSNEFIGLIALGLDLEEFNKTHLYTKQYGNEGYAYMMDGKGICLAHAKDPSLLLTEKIANLDFTKKILASGLKAEFFSYTYKSRAKYLAYAELEAVPWYVCTTMYADDFAALIYQIVIIGVIGTALLILIMAFLINSIVSKPIQMLTKRADGLSVGEGMDAEIKGSGFLELISLCDSLDRLRKSMSIAMKQMREK